MRGALDAMLARLEASVAAGERFTADAGHELRTPLTSIRADLATLRHPRRGQVPSRELEALSDEERERVWTELERDVARVTALLDGLQALARGDAGATRRAPVDVAGHAEIGDSPLGGARLTLDLTDAGHPRR